RFPFVVKSAPGAAPQFAITMDDFNWRNAVHLTAEQRNQAILDTLAANKAKAALFVMGRNADDQEGMTLLRKWDDAGHLIGNHTYSHRSLDSNITAAEYESDILRAELILIGFSRFRKLFRYPMLKEGDTAAKRDGVRAFLKRRGYRIGHVTIDNSDWIVDQRLTARLQKDPNADVKPYRDFYLEHMWDRAQYYDSLAKKVLDRPVKHTILMHFNLLNGLFLGDLIEMFRSKGWQLIDAEEAFTDSVFRAEPKTLPAGESIVWALAKEKGTIAKSLRYPAEDGEYETARMDKLGL
ncbi:MAG TPA: polysaccharide deacetylase family protein, partial [Pyrinomonadaceae bacterium]|nr:polysaccharide deacetylase family protein [Pyrinomonadaceae bacterium]